MPLLFVKFAGLPHSAQIGGTSLLIIVGVALETMKQLESQLVKRHYKGFMK
jgi:preprotein translocase subunit SecY